MDDRVIKHCAKSQPHVRKLKIKGHTLYWGWKSLSIKTITHIAFGKTTSVLQKTDDSVNPNLCVSITTKYRTVDLQFYHQNQRNIWITKIVSILNKYSRAISVEHLRTALTSDLTVPITLLAEPKDDRIEYSLSSVNENSILSMTGDQITDGESHQIRQPPTPNGGGTDSVPMQSPKIVPESPIKDKISMDNPFRSPLAHLTPLDQTMTTNTDDSENTSTAELVKRMDSMERVATVHQSRNHQKMKTIHHHSLISQDPDITNTSTSGYVETTHTPKSPKASSQRQVENSDLAVIDFEEQLRFSKQLLRQRATSVSSAVPNPIHVVPKSPRVGRRSSEPAVTTLTVDHDEKMELELWKIRKQYDDVIANLTQQIKEEKELKLKAQRKCDYLEKTQHEIKRTVAASNVALHSWKQKVHKLKNQMESLKQQYERRENETIHKEQQLQRREAAVKRQFQKMASLNTKLEVANREKAQIQHALTQMTASYEEARALEQTKRLSDHQLTLDLNRTKIKLANIRRKCKAQRQRAEEAECSVDEISNAFMLRMEQQKLKYLKKLREAFLVIDGYEKTMTITPMSDGMQNRSILREQKGDQMMFTPKDEEQKKDCIEDEEEGEEEKGDLSVWRHFCGRSDISEIMESAKCDEKIGRQRAVRILSKFKNVDEDDIEIEDESVEFIANQTVRQLRGSISNPAMVQQTDFVKQLSAVILNHDQPRVLWSRPKSSNDN